MSKRGLESIQVIRKSVSNQILNLNKNKLIPLDARFHDTPPDQRGPLVRRIESYGRVQGLVVDPWGDFSKDLHALVKVMGETKVAARTRSRGRQA